MDNQSNIKVALQENPLRIGVSTRALFDLEKEHKIFEDEGVVAYAEHQLTMENKPLELGSGFQVVKRILALNEEGSKPFVEVILLSRNSSDLSLRAFKSIKDNSLSIKNGSFTSGRPLAPYIKAWNIDLFLSNETTDVQLAVDSGIAAAKLSPSPIDREIMQDDRELRFAFDGDAVIFGPESDQIFENEGLDAFFAHEEEMAKDPMQEGPFGKFLKKLSKLRELHMNEKGISKVRLCLVTARNAPAHERVIRTFRAWGTPADEAHFVGKNQKAPFLKAMRAHIFFDDQKQHISAAERVVPSGHVPGPHSADKPVIPAG